MKNKKIAHRGHLKNLVKKGMIEARCLFRYTDDYAYDNSTNCGRDEQWLPAEFVENYSDGKNGFISFKNWDFGTASGYLSKEKEGGVYSFAIHSNLVYSVRIKELTTDKNLDFVSLLVSGEISQGEHTKTKEPFKILRLNKKISREEFKSFNDWLKSTHSGYWSRFAGGFILPNNFTIDKKVA